MKNWINPCLQNAGSIHSPRITTQFSVIGRFTDTSHLCFLLANASPQPSCKGFNLEVYKQ